MRCGFINPYAPHHNTAVLTGCSFTSSLLFVNVMAVGDTVAVFGGLAIFTGCSFTFNCAFAAVW